MLVDIEWMSRNYDYFNNLFWNGELPRCTFATNRESRRWGFASCKTNRWTNETYNYHISMSNFYDSPEEVKQNTLIHEMIHIADYYFHPEHFIGRRRKYDSHGPEFFLKEAARIAPYGFDIQKYVTAEEQAASQLNPTTKKRVEGKAVNGTPIGLYTKDGNTWYYVKYKSLDDLRSVMRFWNGGSNIICLSHSEEAALRRSAHATAHLAGRSRSLCDIFVKLKVSKIFESGDQALAEMAEAELEKAKAIMNGGAEEPQPTPEPAPAPEPTPAPEPQPEVDDVPPVEDEPIPPTVDDTPEVDTVNDVPDGHQNDMSVIYEKIEAMLVALLLDVNHGPKYTLHIDENDPVRSFKPDIEIERSYSHSAGGGLYFGGGIDVTPCQTLSQLRDMLWFGERDKAVRMMYDKLSAYGILKKKTDEMFLRGTLVERMAVMDNMDVTDEGPLDHVVGLTHAAQKQINDYEWIIAIE